MEHLPPRNSSALSSENPNQMTGWTLSPDVRGTSNIIWSCVLVIFTAVWTVLHLNVPAPRDGYIKIILRRFRWVVLAVLAPDMLTLTAASQWDAARKSVAAMHALDYHEWTMAHAFYANGGGFFIEPHDMRPFPAMAASIHFLLSRGYIEKPSITRAEIWDKSKSDKFAKGAALLQSGWLVVLTIARLAQGLPISPAEIFTLGFIVSTFMSYFFWLHKPQNAGTPTYIKLDMSIAALRKRESETNPSALDPFTHTPLDFIERPLQKWHRRENLSRFDLSARPALRVPDDAILPNLWGPLLYVLVGIPSLLHSTIHLLAWNVHFPTRAEQILWRVASLVLLCVSGLSTGVVGSLTRRGYRGRVNLCWIWVNRSAETLDDDARWWEKMSWRALDVVFTLATLALVAARLCIVLEVIVSFRSLPAGVYQTVRWTGWIPHIE